MWWAKRDPGTGGELHGVSNVRCAEVAMCLSGALQLVMNNPFLGLAGGGQA